MSDRGKRRALIPPTLLSLGNGLCGLTSIGLATSLEARAGELRPIALGGVLILAAMLFDMLDGRLARMTGRTSRFGVEIDSLCDMVSFGVAPVFLMRAITTFGNSLLLWGVGALFTACAAIRLARFNAEHDGSKSAEFHGMPSPAAAGVVASIAAALPALTRLAESADGAWARVASGHLLRISTAALPVAMILVALLMVSKIPYPHLMEELSGGRVLPLRLLPLLLGVAAFVVFHEVALPFLFGAYAIAPPAHLLASHLARQGELYAR